MIIDCISDLHGHFPKLEGGDLLIIAGDLTARDTIPCWDKFFIWLDAQNYRKKVYIGGNHDNFLTQCSNSFEDRMMGYKTNYHKDYLCDSGTLFSGLKIWGSPWTCRFEGINPKCCAFTVDNDEELREKWALIPEDTDILITHSPMLHILDANYDGYSCGSASLRDHIHIVKPKLHVFGHIHEQGGSQIRYKIDGPKTWCVNASYVNEKYQPVNKPMRIVL
jgi:Icc-related predicted phosphoesterase